MEYSVLFLDQFLFDLESYSKNTSNIELQYEDKEKEQLSAENSIFKNYKQKFLNNSSSFYEKKRQLFEEYVKSIDEIEQGLDNSRLMTHNKLVEAKERLEEINFSINIISEREYFATANNNQEKADLNKSDVFDKDQLTRLIFDVENASKNDLQSKSLALSSYVNAAVDYLEDRINNLEKDLFKDKNS